MLPLNKNNKLVEGIDLFKANKLNAAESCFKDVLRNDSTNLSALKHLALVFTMLGRLHEAEPYLKTAIESGSPSVEMFYNYGIVLRALNRPAEALEYFGQAVLANPSVAEIWNNRGVAFNDLRRWQEAIEDFQKALTINPSYSEASFNLGNSLAGLDRYQEALKHYNDAITSKPNFAEAWLFKSKCLIALRQDRDALSCYERYCALQRERNKHLAKGPNAKKQKNESPVLFDGLKELSAIRNTLRFLKPYKVLGVDKVRIGRPGDGGYVQLNDFTNIRHSFSFGIGDDNYWDLCIALRGIPVDQFDHSIPQPPTRHPLLTFNRKKISPHMNANTATLDSVVASNVGLGHHDLILKMDIDGGEWDVFDAVGEKTLAHFAQILCEFHHMFRLREADFRCRAHRVFEKLARQFAVIHVHGNNFGGFCHIGDQTMPDTLEVTFANRARYRIETTDEEFPTSLDEPCDLFAPEIILGRFNF